MSFKSRSKPKSTSTQQNNHKARAKKIIPLKHDNDDSSDNIYEVDKIIDSKVVNGKRVFLVSWKGYDDSENTWEEEENLKNCKESINAYIENLSEKKPVDNVVILAAYANKKEVGYKAKRENGEIFEIIGEKKNDYLKSIIVYLENLIKFSK